MRLEAVLNNEISDHYQFLVKEDISFKEMYIELIKDIQERKPESYISAKFHNTIISIIFAVAEMIRKDTGINKVVLSGGTFQNRYLLNTSEIELRRKDFEVYSHQRVPSNDGGIALGQLVIGARRHQLGMV